ncbi:hypothetical protein PoB_000537100 [Plakobranchus ocellatus]|uniref:Secreted protein n=1 Tax=Plakobranchus ocellatus TaxID=259542 RepID=A0AAV3Y8X4_9GAST|nr:hypothetical protein PoB_000537100 [Plakobranchus ocellatus]
MALRRNFRIIVAAVVMATRLPHQRISFKGTVGHPPGRTSANSRHSVKTCAIDSSCSPQRRQAVVADHPCRARSARRSVCFVFLKWAPGRLSA